MFCDNTFGSLSVCVCTQIVTNLFVNETYVLYQCGTPLPSADLVPVGSKFFEIPLTSVTVLETVPYAYLVSFPSLSPCSTSFLLMSPFLCDCTSCQPCTMSDSEVLILVTDVNLQSSYRYNVHKKMC